ncbi:MAG: SDR family oxidoreductase [Streptococcaceae bacterium]|jgi:3-oxoacyl-[acyl-carrier protein] reductase|nr:SDR family oxidoreductase [Streptococcaceae bacterium]
MGKVSRLKQEFKKYFLPRTKAVTVPVSEDKLLEGMVTLITGGASGIGFAIANRFVQSGSKVIITGRNEAKLKSAVEKLGSEVSSYIIMDMIDVSDIETKVALAFQIYGGVDILINNAGVMSTSRFGQTTEEEFDQVLSTNLKGTYFVSQEVSNVWIKHKIEGKILNISSASQYRPGTHPYPISKAALASLMKGMAYQLIPYGIKVNAIAPGPVATAMQKTDDDDSIFNFSNPSHRMAMPDEVANLALFICSAKGDLMVGSTYDLTGGGGTISLNR